MAKMCYALWYANWAWLKIFELLLFAFHLCQLDYVAIWFVAMYRVDWLQINGSWQTTYMTACVVLVRGDLYTVACYQKSAALSTYSAMLVKNHSYLLSLFGIHTGCAPLMEILQQTFYGTKTTIAWLLVGKNSWTCAKLQALSYWIITANCFRDIIFHFVFILFFLSFYSLAGLTDTLHMETVMNLHYWCSRCTINL